MTYHFGNCVVDERARRLVRAGTVMHLAPKAFDLLVILIRERPNVLSKTDLHERLWPETYVSDASLAMLVAEVRAALGETARQPNAIRTVHRRGYAFQAAVDEGRPAPTVPPFAWWLVARDRQFALTAGENVIGRDPGARVWLDAPSVSRRHARIVIVADTATLEDLGSKNGTRVGETRVTLPVSLEDGAQLTFGSVATTFRAAWAEPTATEGDR